MQPVKIKKKYYRNITSRFKITGRHKTDFKKKWIKILQIVFPLGLNDIIYHDDGNMLKLTHFDMFFFFSFFFLFDIRKQNEYGFPVNANVKQKFVLIWRFLTSTTFLNYQYNIVCCLY